MVEVIIYSKPECHLCEDAKAQLARLQQSLPFTLREVNILENPEHYEEFKHEIPVIFVNGRKAFKFRLDEQAFRRRVESLTKNERKVAHGA